jgi:NOL1/NOP2/fmu family ribosome biogenesis protein
MNRNWNEGNVTTIKTAEVIVKDEAVGTVFELEIKNADSFARGSHIRLEGTK